MRKAVLFLALLGLGACAQEGPDFRGTALRPEAHPLEAYIAAHPGAALTIDSAGGSTAAWRRLVLASTKPGAVSSVTLHGQCVSACMLYALTIAAKGVPVRVADGTVLMMHGIGAQHTAGQPSNQASTATIDLDVALWQFMGLPKWAAEIERGLRVSEFHPLTPAEIDRAGFHRLAGGSNG